jgi:sigma-B regulation protein RsbU (phosphoserine phosphatase)
LELCKAIRQKATEGYVFIIMVTARDRKSDIVEAMDAGADDYVTKPYDKGELLARVRAGFRIVSLEQELSEKNQALLKANTSMKNDLIAAGRLQQSFLPKVAPRVKGFDFSWFFQPCETVAGDSFHCFKVDDDHLALYVLDVSGHGVQAAMLSVMLSRILTPHPDRGGILARKSEGSTVGNIRSPKEIAGILNKRFPMDDEVGQYFTLLYALVYLPTKTMKFVRAGHPYPLYLSKEGRQDFLKCPGCPIGMFEEAEFDEGTISLSSGDRIFLYSDGIVEAVNHEGEIYGTERLAAAVALQSDRDISRITKGILEDVMRFTVGTRIMDDMTLVGVSIR